MFISLQFIAPWNKKTDLISETVSHDIESTLLFYTIR